MASDENLGSAIVRSGQGLIDVENTGTIAGSIDLGRGANRLVNQDDGIIVAGRRIRVGGQGGVLINAGVLIVDEVSHVGRTTIRGELVQRQSGTLAIDLDPARLRPQQRVDLLEVTRGAQLRGTVNVNLLSIGTAREHSGTVTIVSAAGGIPQDIHLAVQGPRSLISRCFIRRGMCWRCATTSISRGLSCSSSSKATSRRSPRISRRCMRPTRSATT